MAAPARALAAGWREYRRNTPGMIGLALLILVVLMALAAPLLADPAGCTRSTRSTTRHGPIRRSSRRWGPTTSGAA